MPSRKDNHGTPISYGKVPVVEIEGFDAQACGGTHMHSPGEVADSPFSALTTKAKTTNGSM